MTRTTDVQIVRLGDVTDEHAIAEGEGYMTVAQWRVSHEQFWRSEEYVADMGELSIDDDTLVVCYRFAIEPRYPASPFAPHKSH